MNTEPARSEQEVVAGLGTPGDRQHIPAVTGRVMPVWTRPLTALAKRLTRMSDGKLLAMYMATLIPVTLYVVYRIVEVAVKR